MAEDESDGGSWWGGWLQTAKEKSSSALEFMKKDLAEFTTTVKDDTSTAACTVKDKLTQENATAATQKVKEGVNTLLGGITKALTVEAEDKNQPAQKAANHSHIFDRAKARLHVVQVDPGTYLNDPEGSPEKYKAWRESFDIDNMKGDISELLVVNVEVRSLYTQMVPSSVSHADFWRRYFYKVRSLKEDEDRRAALVRLADSVNDQQDLEWDEEDWCDLAAPSSPTEESSAQKALPQTNPEKPHNKDTDIVPVVTPARDTQPHHVEKRVPDVGQQIPTDDQNSPKQNVEEMQVDEPETVTGSQTVPEVSAGTNKQTLETTDSTVTATSEAVIMKVDDKTQEPASVQADVLANSQTTTAATAVTDTDNKPRSDSEVELATKIKGDLVVVAPDSSGEGSSARTSPSTGNKESSLDDDWDCDLDVSPEEMEQAEQAVNRLASKIAQGTEDQDKEDDWENWE